LITKVGSGKCDRVAGTKQRREAGVLFCATNRCEFYAKFDVMAEITPARTTVPTHKPRAHYKWVFVPLILIAVIILHWLLFQGREIAPGVIARTLGSRDVS